MRDTIDMAREAGWTGYDSLDERLKAFEALIRADAIADEREACAYRAGIALLGADRGLANRVDQAIRARGNT